MEIDGYEYGARKSDGTLKGQDRFIPSVEIFQPDSFLEELTFFVDSSSFVSKVDRAFETRSEYVLWVACDS